MKGKFVGKRKKRGMRLFGTLIRWL